MIKLIPNGRRRTITLTTFACVLLVAISPANGATIIVDAATDVSQGTLAALNGNGTCSLREALENADSDTAAYADCSAGSGADTIVFKDVSEITFADPITVDSEVSIKGPVIFSGGNVTKMFLVPGDAGDLTVTDIIFQDGYAGLVGGAIHVGRPIQVGGIAKFTCVNSTFKNNFSWLAGGAIFSNGELSLNRCNFESNSTKNNGGAIFQGGTSEVTILDSNFIQNSAGTDPTWHGSGGALWIASPNAKITSTRFIKNRSASSDAQGIGGGGAIFQSSGLVTITSSIFSGNETSGGKWHGGAIYTDDGATLSVNFSHFGTAPLAFPVPFDTLSAPNRTTGIDSLGGAVYSSGPASVVGTSFIGNESSSDGGAYYNASNASETIMANSTLSDNVAARNGGAIYYNAVGAKFSLVNCTISANTASQGGGGLFAAAPEDAEATENDGILLLNTILASNLAQIGANCSGEKFSTESQSSLVFPADSQCANILAITEDPALSNFELSFNLPTIATFTRSLAVSSAAIGKGSPSICADSPISNLDQRGFVRPQGDTNCDIGAYEASAVFAPATPTAIATSTSANTPNPTTAPATPTNEQPGTPTPTVSDSPTITPSVAPTTLPVPNATSTPTGLDNPFNIEGNCVTQHNGPTQSRLYGTLLEQLVLVRKTAARLVRFSRQLSDKKLAAQSLARSKALYITSRKEISDVPAQTSTCQNILSCSTVSFAGSLIGIRNRFDHQRAIVERLTKALRRTGRGGAGLAGVVRRQSKSLYEAGVAATSSIPPYTIACARTVSRQTAFNEHLP